MLKELTQMLVYLTAALIVVIVAIGLFVRFKRQDKLRAYLGVTLGIAAGYSVSTGATLMFLSFKEMQNEGELFPSLVYPLLGLFLLVALLSIGAYFVSTYKKDWIKYYISGSITLTVIYIILLVSLDALRDYMYETFSVTDNVALGISAFIIFAALVALPLIFGKKTREENHTRSVVYAALCIALSYSLSYLKLFELPQGGSITFASLLPLALYSYMFGIRKGTIAGFIYGALQAIQDPWILHPVQFLLDYPLAFGAIGLCGIFKELKLFKGNVILQFVLGIVAVSFIRYTCHVISGIIVFDIYAQGNPIAWSFLYNAFVFADIAIVVVAGISMLSSKSFRELVTSQNLESGIKPSKKEN